MWLLFLIVWFLLLIVTIKRNLLAATNPVLWMGYGWALTIGLYYTSGIIYKYSLKTSGLIYFLLVFLIFSIGLHYGKKYRIVLGKRFLESNRTIEDYIQDSYKDFYKNNKVYLLIVIIGTGIFLVDFITHNSLEISMTTHTDSTLTFVGVIGKIAALLGLDVWLYNCGFCITNNYKINVSSYVAAGCYLLPGLFTAGRQSILIFLVSTVVVLAYSAYQNPNYIYKKSFTFFVILIIILLMIFSTAVAQNRTVVSNKDALFEYIYNCRMPETTKASFDSTGAFRSFFLEIVFYYSHELPMFQLFYENWRNPLTFGMSQFQLISTNIPSSSKLSYTYIWSEIESMCDSLNVYSHTWRTIAANCIMDYGKIGGLFFIFICGFICGRIYYNVINTTNFWNVILLALLCAGAIFSIQFSPFAEVGWYYPLLWLLIGLPVINSLLKRRSR